MMNPHVFLPTKEVMTTAGRRSIVNTLPFHVAQTLMTTWMPWALQKLEQGGGEEQDVLQDLLGLFPTLSISDSQSIVDCPETAGSDADDIE